MAESKRTFTVRYTVNTSRMKKEPGMDGKSHDQLALIAYHRMMFANSQRDEVVAIEFVGKVPEDAKS